jgi:hypothetical protein
LHRLEVNSKNPTAEDSHEVQTQMTNLQAYDKGKLLSSSELKNQRAFSEAEPNTEESESEDD